MKIHVLKNHHANKTTVVYGDWCLNGCQLFHKDQAETIFNDHYVSEQHREDVMSLFEEGDIKDLLYDIENDGSDQNYKHLLENVLRGDIKVEFNIPHEDVDDYKHLSHYLLAKVGYKPHLDQLVNSDDTYIRRCAARHNYKDLLDVLAHDENPCVRSEVAKHDHKDLLDVLVHDENALVRRVVASHNYKDLLDKLANDEDPKVRLFTTFHGYPEHLKK